MERVRGGSPEAYQELIERCGPHILRIVRRQMHVHAKLRKRFDSNDFVQSVWASFVAQGGDTIQFKDPTALIQYLLQMARNKVVAEVRDRMQAGKRNVHREHSLDGSAAFATEEAISRQPTPSQVAVAHETYDRMHRRLARTQQDIIERLVEGESHEKIAAQMGVTTKTVQRLINRILARGERANEFSKAVRESTRRRRV